MDPPPPSYDEIENGYPQRPIGAPKTSNNIRGATPTAPLTSTSEIRQNNSATGNGVYTINTGANVQRQGPPGNNTVYIAQGQPVYIIPKAAVDEARQAANFRRNCILCFVLTKIIVIAVIVIIILSTDSS